MSFLARTISFAIAACLALLLAPAIPAFYVFIAGVSLFGITLSRALHFNKTVVIYCIYLITPAVLFIVPFRLPLPETLPSLIRLGIITGVWATVTSIAVSIAVVASNQTSQPLRDIDPSHPDREGS